MENNIPKPNNGSEIILGDVGRRYAAGQKLSMTDENMAITATTKQNADQFGPSITDFTVSGPELPEQVKGTLAQHST